MTTPMLNLHWTQNIRALFTKPYGTLTYASAMEAVYADDVHFDPTRNGRALMPHPCPGRADAMR